MLHKSSPKGAQLVFRGFQRKGFSLFAALGREVKVGVLSVATLSTAMTAFATAHSNTVLQLRTHSSLQKGVEDEQELGENVVTTSSRTPLAAEVAARQVMTLKAEELSAAGITSINDVLKLAAAVDVRQRGGFGVQTDVGINGGTFDQITILVNGVSIVNPQTGHNMADFPLNLSDIERIEVLEGAASRLFGSQAFSGAINIVTHSGGAPFEVRVNLGSHSTLQHELRSNLSSLWRNKRFQSTLSAGFRRSDGAVTNSDFSGLKSYWQGRYDDANVRIDAQAGYTTQDYGANSFYSARFPNQWESTQRILTSLKAETKGRFHFAPQLSWLRNYDNFQLIRNTHNYENHHRSDVLTAGLNVWTQWAWGRTALGADLRKESVYSNVLGEDLAATDWVRIPGKTPVTRTDDKGNTITEDKDGGNAYYKRHKARINQSIFAEHTVLFDDWTISLGLLAQRNDAIDQKFRFYPGVDLSYRPAQSWKIFASYNTSLRLPAYTDLYYSSPTHVGNPSLKPEESKHYRLGAAYAPTLGVNVQASLFYTQARNQVSWYVPVGGGRATNRNLDANDIKGVSLAANVDLSHLCNSHFFQNFRVDYAYVDQERKSSEQVDTYVNEYLRHKFVATLQHRLFDRLGASWSFRLQNRNGDYEVWEKGVKQTDAAGKALRTAYGTLAQLSLKLHWTETNYQLYVDLQNLTNNRKVDFANVPQAGRLVMAGLSWKLF